jgi:hypothetical protein
VISKALRDGRQLTRDELRQALEKAGINVAAAHRMSFFMLRAELDGLVCSGPRRGNQFTYMLMEERAPNAKSLPRDEAVVELTQRYFSSHGPATLKDFAWWSGLTVKDAKQGLAELGQAFDSMKVDGKEFWFGAPLTMRRDVSESAHFLPVLDEYVVAYRDVSPTYDAAHFVAAKNRNFASSFVIGGRVLGEWTQMVQDNKVSITLKPFSKLDAGDRHLLDAAAVRYGKFLGVPVVVL